jgi:hypothetical protein
VTIRRKTKKNTKNNEDSSPEKKPLSEPRRNPSIESEPEVGSVNRKHQGEALNEMNASVLSDFTNDARIESNCSSELSLELEPARNSASNFGNCGSNLWK